MVWAKLRIPPHFANRPEFIRRFEAEAQLVTRLEHLHIVPLYDYWREPGGAYLVMRCFFTPAGQAGFVRFDNDDAFVLYASLEDGSIQRQPVSPEGLSEDMCARLRRDLTAGERQHYGLADSPTCPKFADS